MFIKLITTSLIFLSVFALDQDHRDSLVKKLQKDVIDNFVPKAQEVLGKCADGNCLNDFGDYFELEGAEKSICLPYTSCGFYNCMEKAYGCDDVGVHYFTKLAYPTCSSYVKNIEEDKFSKKGIEWIYSVMVCLQKGLVDECELKGNCQKETKKKTCDYITKYTLDFHPSCYINSGVGVCHLPLKDKLAIWKTVNPYLTKDERKQAYRVVFHCLTN